jgi:iron complex outermembrane receptor protein
MIRRTFALYCAIGFGFSSATAFAQATLGNAAMPTGNSPSAEPDQLPDADLNGDIIVTAQRRKERLQDVPVAITAISGTTLREMGASNINDVIARTPGIQFQSPAGAAGFPVFNIRGVTLLDFSYTNEGSVAIYADDIYQGNPAFATQQLFDINRVEVLRGPQGTLYGRNATGGLVSYIANRPTSTWSGNVLAQYGSDNDVVLETAVSGPLSDQLRVRVAGRFNRNDGYQLNQVTNTRLASVDHAVGLRGTVEADLSSTATLSLTGSYSNTGGSEDGRGSFGTRNPANLSQSCSTSQILASLCANAAGFRDPDPDPRRPYSELASIPYAMEAVSGVARLEVDLGFAQLTSLTGYEWGRKTDGIDVDAAAVAGTNLMVRYFIDHKQFSQEVRLGGETGRLKWLVGGFYYTDRRFFTAELTKLSTGNYSDQTIESISGFAQATFAATDTLNLTAGGRYTSDTKTLEDLALVRNPVPGTRNGTVLFLASGKITPSKFTWRLGLDWHVTPTAMLYASAATGFKTGGWNTSLVTSLAAIGPVASENITTYEAGLKSQWLDRQLTLNLTGYYTDYRNIQAAASIPCTDTSCLSPTIGVYLNIGNAKIYGAEAELIMRPSPNFTVNLGLALNYNKLTSPPTVLISGVPLNGKKLSNTPEVSIGGGVTWEPKLNGGASGSLIFATDFKFQSHIFFRPDNTPLAVQPAYAIVGARAGWKSPSGLAVEVFATNLLDTEYTISRTTVGEVAPATWGRPRQIGIRGSMPF